MIIRARSNSLVLLFALRGSILPRIAWKVVVVAGFACGVLAVRRLWPALLPDVVTPMPFTLLGLGLSIFLGSRLNACYERWWEGRRHWGALVSDSRVLARSIMNVLPQDEALQRRCGRRVVAFAMALRDELRGRGEVASDTLAGWLPGADRAAVMAARSRPDAILMALEGEFAELRRDGLVSDMLYRQLAGPLAAMTARQAACERLRSTPMPFAYSLLLHRSAWLFCLLLPFGIAGAVGVLAPLMVAVLATAFFGLDALGDDLEDMFGEAENALPLDATVRGIEISVLQAMGESVLPAPLEPKRGVLL